MFEEDALQFVPDSDIKLLLDCLKPFFPKSVHAYYFIDCLVKWKNKTPELDIGVLCPQGDCRTGAVFFYVNGFDHLACSAYTWTKEGEEALQNSLLTTKRFQWTEIKNIMFTCMTQEVWSLIEPVLPKLAPDQPIRVSNDKVFWLPAEEVLKFDIKVPDGMRLGDLKKEHAEQINNVWPHRSVSSQKLVELMTEVNFGRGLFKENGELISWAFYWFFGALGVVQTAETERRKGYGKVTVEAVSKEMGSLGLDVHLNIVDGNVVSESFFRSLGFKHAFDSVWAFTQKASK